MESNCGRGLTRKSHPDFCMKEKAGVKRQTPLLQAQRRVEWNDGIRVPWWWPRPAYVPEDPAHRSRPCTQSRSHQRERDARRISEGKKAAVRDFYEAKVANNAGNVAT